MCSNDSPKIVYAQPPNKKWNEILAGHVDGRESYVFLSEHKNLQKKNCFLLIKYMGIEISVIF